MKFKYIHLVAWLTACFYMGQVLIPALHEFLVALEASCDVCDQDANTRTQETKLHHSSDHHSESCAICTAKLNSKHAFNPKALEIFVCNERFSQGNKTSLHANLFFSTQSPRAPPFVSKQI